MKSLSSRLEKLEALHPPSQDCPECGYPGRAQPRVVLTYHDDPMPTCSMGHPLDTDGVPLLSPYARIILPPD
jgi:Na+-translocating ferredoxin:NAD+ oxidoreductase RNF subunit RnfB